MVICFYLCRSMVAWGEVTLCYLLPKPTTNAKCIDSLCPLLLWQIVRHSLLSHLPQRLVNNIVATTAKGHTITNPFGCRAVPGGCAVKSVGWEQAEVLKTLAPPPPPVKHKPLLYQSAEAVCSGSGPISSRRMLAARASAADL